MKFGKRIKKENGEDYSKTMADLLLGLLLVIILILMLAFLYLIQKPDEDENGPGYDEPPETVAEYKGDEDGHDWHRYDHDNDGHQIETQPQNGGGGQTPVEIRPDDEGEKTAVYVEVLDAETGKRVKEKDIEFQLYKEPKQLQTLYTYYPEKIAFKSFKTTADGTFYLPEKVEYGGYYFHEITEAYGYDKADDVYFDADEYMDWDEPIYVKIPVFPLKNVIKVQVKQKETGYPVAGWSYDVIAARDIITLDGTLRYAEGTVADTIYCNEDGYGESKELYLGLYRLEQKTVPRFYAADKENISVNLEKKVGKEEKINSREYQMTTFRLRVLDELKDDIGVAGAVFTLSGENMNPKTVKTDDTGTLSLQNLEKNRSYLLTQTKSSPGYQIQEESVSFSVSEDGFINDEPVFEAEIRNRTLRLNIKVQDILLGSGVSGKNVSLYGPDGELIRTWDSNGGTEKLEGLREGVYSVAIGGNTAMAKKVTVQNTAQEQVFGYRVWTVYSFCITAFFATVLIGILTFLTLRRVSRKKN